MQQTRSGAGNGNVPRLFSSRPGPQPRRSPPHPGAFLESRFLKPLDISQDALAQGLGISRRRVNELINGKRGISADTALRLGVFFGTGPDLWLGLQQAWDLHRAWRRYRDGGAASDTSGQD